MASPSYDNSPEELHLNYNKRFQSSQQFKFFHLAYLKCNYFPEDNCRDAAIRFMETYSNQERKKKERKNTKSKPANIIPEKTRNTLNVQVYIVGNP
jgi:hypothetical protein